MPAKAYSLLFIPLPPRAACLAARVLVPQTQVTQNTEAGALLSREADLLVGVEGGRLLALMKSSLPVALPLSISHPSCRRHAAVDAETEVRCPGCASRHSEPARLEKKGMPAGAEFEWTKAHAPASPESPAAEWYQEERGSSCSSSFDWILELSHRLSCSLRLLRPSRSRQERGTR